MPSDPLSNACTARKEKDQQRHLPHTLAEAAAAGERNELNLSTHVVEFQICLNWADFINFGGIS